MSERDEKRSPDCYLNGCPIAPDETELTTKWRNTAFAFRDQCDAYRRALLEANRRRKGSASKREWMRRALDAEAEVERLKAWGIDQQRAQLSATRKATEACNAARERNDEVARLRSDLAAERKALADSEARARELTEGLCDCIELAEEGWSYADEYFREKWDFAERIAQAKETFAGKGKKGGA